MQINQLTLLIVSVLVISCLYWVLTYFKRRKQAPLEIQRMIRDMRNEHGDRYALHHYQEIVRFSRFYGVPIAGLGVHNDEESIHQLAVDSLERYRSRALQATPHIISESCTLHPACTDECVSRHRKYIHEIEEELVELKSMQPSYYLTEEARGSF